MIAFLIHPADLYVRSIRPLLRQPVAVVLANAIIAKVPSRRKRHDATPWLWRRRARQDTGSC